MLDHSLSDDVRINIIQPNYVNEVTTFLKARSCWRSVGMLMETTSKVMLGISSVVSFASCVYTNYELGFVSGSISTLSLVSLQFANFAFRESKRSTEHLNVLLNKLHVETLPNFSLKDTSPPASEVNDEKKESLKIDIP
jgi:hypothetical protein